MKLPRCVFFCAVAAGWWAATAGLVSAAGEWRPLFNGRDLSGWQTWLGKPQPTSEVAGLARDEKGAYTAPIGPDRDPLRVFTVTQLEGQPVLHVSGEVFGVVSTREEFSNFHVRLQFKWGDKRWAPRLEAVRDSGLLYHGHGAPGVTGTWPASVELQIQEQDCGDLWTIGATRIAVLARARLDNGKPAAPIYDPAGELMVFETRTPTGGRCVKLADHERPRGEWNTIEVVCVGEESLHIVNGQVVMRLRDAQRQEGEAWQPLRRGQLHLQSEGAELYYRGIEIRTVDAVPPEFAAR